MTIDGLNIDIYGLDINIDRMCINIDIYLDKCSKSLFTGKCLDIYFEKHLQNIYFMWYCHYCY